MLRRNERRIFVTLSVSLNNLGPLWSEANSTVGVPSLVGCKVVHTCSPHHDPRVGEASARIAVEDHWTERGSMGIPLPARTAVGVSALRRTRRQSRITFDHTNRLAIFDGSVGDED